jgi:hypothetical protein
LGSLPEIRLRKSGLIDPISFSLKTNASLPNKINVWQQMGSNTRSLFGGWC